VALEQPHDDATLARAERATRYRFQDRSLLSRALTHPSVSTESTLALDYERLEFLGDAVLGMVVVEEIYRRYPELSEGDMTKLKIHLVSGGSLVDAAERLGLAELIALGESERGTGTRGLRSALENAFEAIVGAIYLDGGLDPVRAFICETLGPRMSPDAVEELDLEHPKSRLQEIVQADGRFVEYRIVSEEGPPHDRTFTAEVLVGDRVMGTGTGATKKEAEMCAAREALSRVSAG
jgi:ribonuclease III